MTTTTDEDMKQVEEEEVAVATNEKKREAEEDNDKKQQSDNATASAVTSNNGSSNKKPRLDVETSTTLSLSSFVLPKFLLFGDSLTQLSFGDNGFATCLANVYQRRADIINRGCSGYNTDWYIKYIIPNIEAEFTKSKIELVTLFFGPNDSSLPELNARQYVSIEKYETNLKWLIKFVQNKLNCNRIILIGPPPVCHAKRLQYQIQRYGDKATGKLERTYDNSGIYSKSCNKVANSMDCPFIDLWTKMQQNTKNEDKGEGGEEAAEDNNNKNNNEANDDEKKEENAETEKEWSKYLCDGLHLSQEGNQFVFEQIIDCINTNFSDEIKVDCDPITKQWCNSASKSGTVFSSQDNNTVLGPFHDKLKPLPQEE